MAPFSPHESPAFSRNVFARLSGNEVVRNFISIGRIAKLPVNLAFPNITEALITHKPPHRFCTMMHENPNGCDFCRQLHTDLNDRLSLERKGVQVECVTGLLMLVAPVFAGDMLVANLTCGPVLIEKPHKSGFARLAGRLEELGIRLDLRQLEEVFSSVRVLSERRLVSLLRILQVFAEHLSDAAVRELLGERQREPQGVRRARAFVQSHVGDHPTMTDAAQVAGLSPSHFSRMFRRATGLTFSRYLALLRVEHAKELIRSNHDRITEVAFDAGFESIPTFNRVFRQFTGMSPTEYRRSLR